MNPEHENIAVTLPFEEVKYKKRSAWAAFFLTSFVYGLGHVYCGEIKRGIRLFIIYDLCFFIVFGFLKFIPNVFSLILIILFLFPFSIYIYIDSIRIARRKKEYSLQKYNRWYIYTAIIIIYVAINIFPFGYIIPERYGTPTGSMENTVMIGDKVFGNNLAYGIKYPLTEKYIMHFNMPERNDVIYFNFPGFRDEVEPSTPVMYLKRIAGIPGDTLLIIDKKLYINGMRTVDPRGIQYFMKIVSPRSQPNKEIFPKGSGWNPDNYGPLYIPKKGDVLKFNSENINGWITFIEREGNIVLIEGGNTLINGEKTFEYKVKRNYYFVMGDNRDNALDSRYWGLLPEENILGKITMVYWSWDRNISYSEFTRLIASIRWNRIGTIIE